MWDIDINNFTVSLINHTACIFLFLLFQASNLVCGAFGHRGVPVIDGDAGLTRGEADGVTDPGVDRMPLVQPIARGVCDEGGRALVTSGMYEELKTVLNFTKNFTKTT